jgi:hypothetical protein
MRNEVTGSRAPLGTVYRPSCTRGTRAADVRDPLKRPRRWVVERLPSFPSWLHRSRRLLVRRTKLERAYLALVRLACALLCFQQCDHVRVNLVSPAWSGQYSMGAKSSYRRFEAEVSDKVESAAGQREHRRVSLGGLCLEGHQLGGRDPAILRHLRFLTAAQLTARGAQPRRCRSPQRGGSRQRHARSRQCGCAGLAPAGNRQAADRDAHPWSAG